MTKKQSKQSFKNVREILIRSLLRYIEVTVKK